MRFRFGITVGLVFMAAACSRAADPLPDWIASKSAGGIHIKLGDLWKSAPGQKLLEVLDKHQSGTADLTTISGVAPRNIDRLSIVLLDIGPRPDDGLVMHVTTAAPFDRESLLKNLKARPFVGDNPKMPNRNGSTFLLADNAMLFLGGPRAYTIVYSEDAGYDLLGQLLSEKTAARTGLAEHLEKHTLTAWLDGTRLPKDMWESLPVELQPLRDAQSLVLTGDLAEQAAQLSVQLHFARGGLAADGLRALEEGRILARDALTKLEKDLRGDLKGNAAVIELVREMQKTIAAARFRHSNLQVAGTARLELAPPLQAAFVDGVGYLQLRANRVKSMNNIKQISLAFHNYEAVYGNLPPAAICDKNGKPLLSWRVAVLPFIEQEQLYRQFKMDEPWDSEHNKKLIQHMPEIYRLPGDRTKHQLPSTHYQVFVGGNAIFQLTRGGKIAEIPDGTSNTIWLAEAATPVPWTKPDDMEYDATKPPKVGYHFGDRCNVGFADGSVRSIRKSLKPEILHLLIQKNDGQVLPPLDD